MKTLVVGLNFQTCPVVIREKLAFDESACRRALHALAGRFPGSESVILSTCNRVEAYFARLFEGHPRTPEAIEFLGEFHGVPAHEFSESVYHYEDSEAIRHLFRVVSSLDSMVLGESQILAQAKAALAMAEHEHTAVKAMPTLFQRAFAVAKEIHTQTGIGLGKLSVGSVAVDFARQIFSGFHDKTVLMIGAGEMGEAMLQHLLALRPRRVWVTSRTLSRAEELARRYQAEARNFADLTEHLAEADIVITSTGSPKPIITEAMFAEVPARRQYRPLQIIDIAVPRDVEPEVGQAEGVFLYNIDELQQLAESSLARRRSELDRCHEIIERNVRAFAQWRAGRDVGASIHELQEHLEELTRQEVEWLAPKLSGLTDRDRDLLRQFAHRVSRKIMHLPNVTLNEHANNGGAQVYIETLRTLFGLEEREDER
jgi:glutamyl-tRNA reductase